MDYKVEYAKLAAQRDKMLVEAEVIFQRMMRLQFLIDHGAELRDEAKAAMEAEVDKK